MTVDITDIDPFSWQGISTLRQRCESVAASEGLAGVHLFFRGQELFADALNKFPSYRERQEAWKAKHISGATKDPLREALEAIRDGHNDPRSLASEVLESMEQRERQ